ncbi:hypothetical protein MHM95_12455 [Pseudoalteromonas sp. CnMc7-15]|uniref:hypothetical protein n=1 Tax=Pseudoalteromonas TaxID=53246 RepID=UPI00110894D0|nr:MULTISPECIES: hypothetical protein [Pseudoalteromonas]MCG7567092.1 hypothetical protein [Pseudoalteromonas sp. CnMc7-15]TLX52049.1 hypothetical protein CWC31_02550 [Pseudoalteromonas ruthenica]
MTTLTTKIANEVINTANEAIRFLNHRSTMNFACYCEDTFTNLLRITKVLAEQEGDGLGAVLHDAIQSRLDDLLAGKSLTLIEVDEI